MVRKHRSGSPAPDVGHPAAITPPGSRSDRYRRWCDAPSGGSAPSDRNTSWPEPASHYAGDAWANYMRHCHRRQGARPYEQAPDDGTCAISEGAPVRLQREAWRRCRCRRADHAATSMVRDRFSGRGDHCIHICPSSKCVGDIFQCCRHRQPACRASFTDQ